MNELSTRLPVRTRDWLTATAFFLVAAAFRLVGLGNVKGYIFDEVYYAKDAHSIAQHGVELTGNNVAEFVVHPPVGKWLIAAGIKLFGFNEFGWRFSAAIIGSLAISVMYFVAQRLFNNYFLSVTASLFMLVDGLELVHSRVALLDIFLMFFLLLTLLFLLQSKHWLAGISLGLAAGVKWTGFYYFIAIFAFVIYVDYRNHRAMEEERPILKTVQRDGVLRVTQYLVLPVVTYFLSWTGWVLNSHGWDRSYSKSFGGFARSLIHYHSEILNFHKGLHTAHPYQSNPWSWLIMGRPTSFWYTAPKDCGAKSCSAEILGLGTPLLWWSITIAIAVAFGYWIARREWQSGLLLLFFGAGYLPWFLFQKRTMFSFYSIAFEPFAILLLVYVIAKYLEGHSMKFGSLRDNYRFYSVILLIVAVVLCFLYFFPLYVGQTMTYSDWFARMWFSSWI